MSSFQLSFEKTIINEGGYSNNPADFGGETYKGIARTYHPTWSGWKRLDSYKSNKKTLAKKAEEDALLQLDVRNFYTEHFWNPLLGDDIPNQEIADELFDTAVNLGVKKAITFLQQGLNYLSRRGKLYESLVEDGAIGKKTITALKIYLQKDSPEYLLKIMNILQGMHYLNFIAQSPEQEIFARGWLKRVKM